ncbi:MAG: hypothetical protein GDA51_01865 [Ekhidna sp.]|nr:hypothetical protein [Ekhidna sp.]MBC6410913.1 hypothetical protein [Ekhidna sp.]MBC6425222.1 hypothetical protein [Ekhidna sp.]
MSKKDKAKVHKDLEGLDLNVDSFGEIKSSMPIDRINKFLNKNVDDRKLKDRNDLDDLKKD